MESPSAPGRSPSGDRPLAPSPVACADPLEQLFRDQLSYVGELADEASAQSDPWAGLSGFLDGVLALQAEYRGLLDYMCGPAAPPRAAASTARLTPVIAELLARAKAGGQVRSDVSVMDVALVPVMVGAVVDRSRDLDPELWRRMLALLLDGLRPGFQPLPGRPVDLDELHRLLGARQHDPR